MRRSREGTGKEKWIMAISSVLVLSAFTITGLFIRGRDKEQDNGYVVDFSAMEKEGTEQARNDDGVINEAAGNKRMEELTDIEHGAVTSDDLDYDPYYQETNSVHVENEEQKMTDKSQGAASSDGDSKESGQDGMKEGIQENTGTSEETAAMEKMEDTLAIASSTSIQPALTFGDEDMLAWPIVGNVLINYSMDKTVYFPTLEQYKYNPAIIIAATEGETITAAADGKVKRVYTDPELGNAVIMELGNGYELTYGQLKDITVSEGGFVNRGDIIGSVAAPTKYFAVEGCNVYFKLTKDGIALNPMTKLQ